MSLNTCSRSYISLLLTLLISLAAAAQLHAQTVQAETIEGRAFYDALQQFTLRGKASVSGLTLKRDRLEMTFTGDFYFAAPVAGKVTGAVFIGTGAFKAPAPELAYEKENMQRFLNATVAESDFKTAVLRFSDDTFTVIGGDMDAAVEAPVDAQKLARELEPRLLQETGANISARLLLSLINQENPGFFLAQFDKGKLGRFTCLVDKQTRIPSNIFNINGGEKVMMFSYAPHVYINDIIMATYADSDFANNKASYSDEFDLVSPTHYEMEIDLRQARKILRTSMKIDFIAQADNLRVIPMTVNDGLTAFNNVRKNESMRLQSARFENQDIPFIQEDWEIGLTFVLPRAMKKGEKFSVSLALEGDFIDNQDVFLNCYYPQSNESWYPRHGYLKRATYRLLFRHDKNDKVAAIGKRVREGAWPDSPPNSADALTEYVMEYPIALVSFAAGKLERHTEKRKLSFGEVELEFFSVPSSVTTVKEDFMLAEMGNVLEYFGKYFGPYPYGVFRAAIHPFNFGQGFPTMLLIPPADEANREVFSFLSHESSHQWWGNIVAWRSYRDQWLSEGFAEYSGMLYTGLRYNLKAQKDLIDEARYELPFPPTTDRGIGKIKRAEIGPLILGLRLNSRLSGGTYQSVIYNKGALVLRMLHFLFSDPNTGSGQAFFDMMSDFVKRYKNRAATTEEFISVAGAHFANTPLAKMFGLKDLNWFFQQWVYEAKLPSYRMEYKIESAAGGQAVLYRHDFPGKRRIQLVHATAGGSQIRRTKGYGYGLCQRSENRFQNSFADETIVGGIGSRPVDFVGKDRDEKEIDFARRTGADCGTTKRVNWAVSETAPGKDTHLCRKHCIRYLIRGADRRDRLSGSRPGSRWMS